MNAAQSDSTKEPKTILRCYAQQIIVAGMAFSLTFLVELLGRDALPWQSFWALVLFSITLPLWLLTWTVERQLEHVRAPQSESWNDRFSSWFAFAFVCTMVAAGLELFRVMGWLIIGFELFLIWTVRQLVQLVEDHRNRDTAGTVTESTESRGT